MSQYEDITDAKRNLQDAVKQLSDVRKLREGKEKKLFLRRSNTSPDIPTHLEDVFITLVEAHYVKLVDKLKLRLADACHDYDKNEGDT